MTISPFPHWEHQGLAIIAFIAFVVLLVLTCRAARRGNARRYLFSGLAIVAAFLTIGLFEWALRSFDGLPTADCGTAQEHQPVPECVKRMGKPWTLLALQRERLRLRDTKRFG